MQKLYLQIIIKCLLLFLITTQVNAKHNFSNIHIINDEYALIIYNEVNGDEVILREGHLVEGNLFTGNKRVYGQIISISKKTIDINGEEVAINDIKRIRKKRTQANRILKITGLLFLITGAAFSIIGASGAVLFAGLIILGLVIAFQSNYINLENPDVKTEVKEL